MATIMSSTSTVVPATVTTTAVNAKKRFATRIVNIGGMNSYGGLKADTAVIGLGRPATTEQCFAKVVGSLRPKSGGRGGALSSTCNAAAEIFRIAAIMNGLVLVGVAVGFVLLRIEASVEEAE